MAITMRRLAGQVSHLELILRAGEGGLDREVTWAHFVETSMATEYLEGGEVVFMTGIGISSEEEFPDFLQHLMEKQVAGVIINTGAYLEEVPQSAIDFCNTNDLPLFEVPWKIHLEEMLRIFIYTLSKEDRRLVETAAAFQNALFFPQQQELYLIPLKNKGFQADWPYCVCLITPRSPEDFSASQMEKLASSLRRNLEHFYENFSCFSSNLDIVIILGNYTDELVHDFISNLKRYLELQDPDGEKNYAFGVGKITKSIRCLYKSFRQAHAVQKLQMNGKISEDKIYYTEMGIYKLLMNIEDTDIISEYLEHTIQPLLDYDRENNADLVSVLRTYLNNNGSTHKTADALFVHRNTINYRLSKIQDLTGLDLSLIDSRLQLQTALMLMDMQ